MSRPLAIVPCRTGSKGIPRKNWRPLGGVAPLVRAAQVANLAGCGVVFTSDASPAEQYNISHEWWASNGFAYLCRSAPLHTDECSMRDVVADVLASVPGPDDQIVLLVQPTQPLRKPEHLLAAIELLKNTEGATSVVSVVPTESPAKCLCLENGKLAPWLPTIEYTTYTYEGNVMSGLVERRQEAKAAYKRDGTVYAFYRATVAFTGDIYGWNCLPLFIPASETCTLDTPEDWEIAEQRLHAMVWG